MTNILLQPNKDQSDLAYWADFVETFFSPGGTLYHCVLMADEGKPKQFAITFPALARYFHTHFESGMIRMQMVVERSVEKRLLDDYSHIESKNTSFIYQFDNGSQVRHILFFSLDYADSEEGRFPW